jgi:hypothetical protein
MWYVLENANSGKLAKSASPEYAFPSQTQQHKAIDGPHDSSIEKVQGQVEGLGRKRSHRLIIPLQGGWVSS